LATTSAIDLVIGCLDGLLRGDEVRAPVVPPGADEAEREMIHQLARLVQHLAEMREAVVPLARGELDAVRFARANYLASPLRELHSRLKHLAWQGEQVAAGDYSQRIDFMGGFSEAFNSMVESLARHEQELRRRIDELEAALARISDLEGLLPVCCHCGKIRCEGQGAGATPRWESIQQYVERHSLAQFSHTICPKCLKEHYGQNPE
jgi:hypothetical protein